MLIALLLTCSVSFQRPHCPSPRSSWSFPTSLLHNNSNILFATLCALIVLFRAYCHPYHAYRSPPLPTKKKILWPSLWPCHLSRWASHPSACPPSSLSSSSPAVIPIVPHHLENEWMFFFFPKALPSLLVLPVVLPKASCSPPCPHASLSSF